MLKIRRFLVVFVLAAGVLLSACGETTPYDIPALTSTLSGTLRPDPSATATALPTGTHSPLPSPTITPSPEPIYYEVQSGDNFSSIAARYGIDPADLMTANPTVNASVLQVGTSLLIPVTLTPKPTPTITAELSPTPTKTAELSPTPTPQAMVLSDPACYPDALGGLWCFVLVENTQDAPLENVSGLIVLGEGEDALQEVAITPLNLLTAGEALPMSAYFLPPLPENIIPFVQIDYFLPVMTEDDRYLPAEIVEQNVDIQDDGQMAVVSGEIRLPGGQPAAGYVWVNATAFDQEGLVVGIRRWEAEDDLTPGGGVPFELRVYSLGGSIERVDVLVEAGRSLGNGEE